MTVERLLPALIGSSCLLITLSAQAEDFQLQLRSAAETSPDSGRFHTVLQREEWNPSQTALIVCDVWDSHNCYNAVQRVNEFAPRLNKVVEEARQRGTTIIHAPSNCMDFYADHPCRARAETLSKSPHLPDQITQWCYQIPSEERGTYPIDQTDGGCDDTPEEHATWEQELVRQGRREQKWPWIKQTTDIHIDESRDYISDRGDEIWSILEHHGIENVIMTGVHTNMCVLGRPFGLRRMAQNGKNVVLMRDMTDTMYNPGSAPYVSHFTGTDLIVGHIEKYVCPTITSDQIIGGDPFRFQKDIRPHLAIMMAEDEYETNTTLPEFAVEELGQAFRVSLIFGSDRERNNIPGLEALNDADVLLVSVRRRVLPQRQMHAIQKFVAAGKPVVGIRTASHAFSLRNSTPPEGYADWTAFDADVFGGNYHGHHGNQLVSTVRVHPEAADHPVVAHLEPSEFQSGGSLYQTSPLKDGTTVLLSGEINGAEPEPVAWTFRRADGGRSFYTSLGHVRDFEHPTFRNLLANGIHWAAGSASTP